MKKMLSKVDWISVCMMFCAFLTVTLYCEMASHIVPVMGEMKYFVFLIGTFAICSACFIDIIISIFAKDNKLNSFVLCEFNIQNNVNINALSIEEYAKLAKHAIDYKQMIQINGCSLIAGIVFAMIACIVKNNDASVIAQTVHVLFVYISAIAIFVTFVYVIKCHKKLSCCVKVLKKQSNK